jgi:hypothetical protein
MFTQLVSCVVLDYRHRCPQQEASWHVRRTQRRTSAAARQSVSSGSRYRLLVLHALKAARPMLRLRRRLAMCELSTFMSSRFPTFHLHHSGLWITKTRRLRKAKRLRGGGDVVVAEAAAVAEAVGAAEAAEGVAADCLRLLTVRAAINSSQPPQYIIEPGSTPRGLFSFTCIATDGWWRMSRRWNAQNTVPIIKKTLI